MPSSSKKCYCRNGTLEYSRGRSHWTVGYYIDDQDSVSSALTIIDIDTNAVKSIRTRKKSAQHIANAFENNWLATYPKPMQSI